MVKTEMANGAQHLIHEEMMIHQIYQMEILNHLRLMQITKITTVPKVVPDQAMQDSKEDSWQKLNSERRFQM